MNVIKHTLRNEDMDVLKGIGMCLVLIAHSAGGFVHTFAYSFHMPLFFIASGYFYKPRGIMEGIKSDFKRLMIPFFFTEIVIFVGSILLIGVGNNNIVRPSEALEMLYYGNGGSDNYGKIWGNFASVGSVWFLPALFWAKTIYNAINHITPPQWHLQDNSIYYLMCLCGRNRTAYSFSVLYVSSNECSDFYCFRSCRS